MNHVKLFAVVLGALVLTACTSTRSVKTTNEFTPTQQQARIILIEPDIELAFLKASGISEVRADWTRTGKELVLAELRKALAASEHVVLDHELDSTRGREMQLIKLHEVVGGTIYLHRFLGVPLPTKDGTFDWTLGPGVQKLAAEKEADYALFLFARGEYASSGRQMLAIGLAAAGVGGVTNGGQAAYASLVDLKSGDIVWFNIASTGAGTDMREAKGAAYLVQNILKDFPLGSE